ncbi:hypothetical protein KC19_VG193700 [Ceratodon purpureus]|uniref:Uncharacterized protein n=1 Tax=Ceratodon purpureus TaxID=3225 RepID=A0A8T0HST6_CERPU|nr:hypothetical protein KC19_VG193700 [Ceratodon purpureus]
MAGGKSSGIPKAGLARRGRDEGGQESAIAFQFQYLHSFGFSGESGRFSQIAVLDSHTVVYAIGCGLYRWRDGFAVPIYTPEDSVEKIVALVSSFSGHLVGACEKTKFNSTQVSVYDVRMFKKVGVSFKMKYNAEIQICAFSKDESLLMAASKFDAGGSWICCWEFKHSQASII